MKKLTSLIKNTIKVIIPVASIYLSALNCYSQTSPTKNNETTKNLKIEIKDQENKLRRLYIKSLMTFDTSIEEKRVHDKIISSYQKLVDTENNKDSIKVYNQEIETHKELKERIK